MTAKELLPVAKVLEKRGFLIRHIVDQSKSERATTILNKSNILYTKELPTQKDTPDVIISGTSAVVTNAQIEWTKFGRDRGIPTIWFEDTYGTNRRALSVSPDIICVIDDIASDMINDTKRNVRVKVVGKPSFEGFIKYIDKTLEIRKNTCEKLNISENAFIVTLWSGGLYLNRIEAHIKALYNLNELTNREVVYLPRMHPKLQDKPMFELALSNNLNVIDTSHLENSDELILTSNVNVAEWSSNVMYAGVMFGIPSIMCLFPDHGPDNMQERIKVGFKDGTPPLVMEKAGWGANSPENLRNILSFIMNNEHKAIKQVKNNSSVFRKLIENIGAADRIADVVENSIRERREVLN
jgi:hypothetical protein